MLALLGREFALCGGSTRRSFLKVGGLGLGGLTLPALLRARQAQAASERKDTAVILFWMAGGPSHIDMYDMKPDQPEAIRGPFRPIPTRQAGLDVCELLPRHAAIADRFSLVRSLHHGYAVHDDAQHLVQTGHPALNARQRGQLAPCQGAVTSLLRGPNAPGMPAYVCIPEAYSSPKGFYQLASYAGARHNPLAAGGDPELGNYRTPELALPADLSIARLENRRQLLRSFDGMTRRVEKGGAVEILDDVQQQAFELVTGSRARAAFDVAQEPDALRDRYGRHFWGHAALLSRRLVEAGVTFVTINLYERNVDWWDDHFVIEKNLRKRLPPYDQALCTLIEDLHERGLSERVLVVACGEFGRAPRIDANAGRGHWPRAGAALLAGGGVRSGRIVGSTTPDGGDVADSPASPGDLLATIYRVLGIDPHTMIHDHQDRPVRIVETGKPIAELFA